MAQQTINSNATQPLGLPNTGIGTDQGDTWDTAASKLNANFTELYALVPVGGTAGQVTASKALVVDANKALTGMGNLTFQDGAVVDFGASAGSVIGANATRKIAVLGAAPYGQDTLVAQVTTTAAIATFGWGFATSQQAALYMTALNALLTAAKARGFMATA